MNDPVSIEDFKISLSKKGKKKATIDSYQRDVKGFHSYLAQYGIPLNHVDADLLRHYVQFLEDKHGRINSVRRSIIGIRQYFRFLAESKAIACNPLEKLPIPARDEHLAQPLSLADLRALLAHTGKSSPQLKGLRDASIISLLAFEGLKVSELIDLAWADFIFSANLGSLRITGPRSRVIPLHRETTAHILNYKIVFDDTSFPAGEEKKFQKMILAFNGRDTMTISPGISRHGLKFLLYELAPAIGRDKLNTEMLRHFAITHHLRDGKSAEEIMQHFGLRRPGNINKHIASILKNSGDSPL